MSIFKACDIRGVYPDELDEGRAFAIGRAIGTELGGAACVLGGDLRPSTPPLMAAVQDGLCRSGADVVVLGAVPTPVVHWARRALGAHGAVIVTASHNPPRYNGIKFALGDRPVMPQDVTQVEQRVRAEDFADGRGKVSARDVRADYLGWIESRFAGTGAGLCVVVDAGNGCAARWAPPALRAAGYDVRELFCEPDGTFPNRPPNPSAPDALREASRVVEQSRADLAIAFDGDADRVVFIDEKGACLDSDKAIIIFARAVLAREPGASVVYDLKCTRRVAEEVERAGGRPVAERSGYAFIKSRLLDEDAPFAGEASGHFFFRELGGDDGIYAALRMGAIVAAGDRRLSELASSIPPYFITPDLRVPRAKDDGAEVVERLKRVFAERPQDHTDGVRVEFDHGWALCRVSVTEPVITLRFEGDSPEALEAIRQRVLSEIPPA